MEQSQTIAGTKKPCCADDTNLRVISSNMSMTVRKCAICGCRHFEATLLPANMKVKQV